MIEKLRKELRQLADPQKAEVLQRYFKTGKGEYAEGDKFLGITMPDQRRLVKKYWKDFSTRAAAVLLKSMYHEERMSALLILIAKFQKANGKEKNEIFDLYLANTKFINNWDLVDISAPHIVGTYLEGKDKAILFKLAKSKSLWERRIAMLSTFCFIRNGDCRIALEIAEVLLGDKEDLIHKAVGWMLREIGKNCGREVEEEFLKKHYKIMPRVTLRYAIEHFDEQKRKYYLELK